MTLKKKSDLGISLPLAFFLPALAASIAVLAFFRQPIRQFVRESVMQRVTSAHYDIRGPRGALSQASMTEFATRRERLFKALNKKLGDADANMKIRVVFDPTLYPSPPDETGQDRYSVTGTIIRAKLTGQTPQLPAAADAEALLDAAWGPPGNPQTARWTAVWLVGDWHGTEIGMAAAQVEQRLGHKKLASLLSDPGGEIASSSDQTLLGAAWLSEIAEFGGASAVRKLYSAKMPHPSVAEVTKVLSTTPLELDRKWQLWMFAYLAGMPSIPPNSAMPMDMPMPGSGSESRPVTGDR